MSRKRKNRKGRAVRAQGREGKRIRKSAGEEPALGSSTAPETRPAYLQLLIEFSAAVTPASE